MRKILCVIALSLLAALPAQAAEKCTLLKIAALKLKPLANGSYAIPLSIGGTPRDFELSLNAPFSAISGTLADAQGYKSLDLPSGMVMKLGGESIRKKVMVGDLALGPSHGSDFDMLRSDNKKFQGTGLAGVVGLDLLQNFDVELNLSKQELNLFAHSDCDDKVYWATSYADANIKKDTAGHIAFGMFLDDKLVSVDLDTRDGSLEMGTNTAKRLLNLTPESPGVTSESDGTATIWHYPFKTLALDGVAINNPHITIFKDDDPECRSDVAFFDQFHDRCFGSSNLHMHGNTLKALHLYIAFEEKKVYITGADAHL